MSDELTQADLDGLTEFLLEERVNSNWVYSPTDYLFVIGGETRRQARRNMMKFILRFRKRRGGGKLAVR